MSPIIRKCDCCGRERESHVCSSALGAVSFAYCSECLTNNAELKNVIIGTIEMLNGDVASWVLDLNYYDDGYKSAKILKENYEQGERLYDFEIWRRYDTI